MKYLVVDTALSGTGIRDKYNGSYISLNEHFNGYRNIKQIDTLNK